MKKYVLFAVLSGCAWAAVAFVLSYGAFNADTVLGGIIASPFIGLFIGFVFLPAYKLPKLAQFGLSLISLYLAVALFGLAVGLWDATRNIPNRTNTVEVIFQSMLGALFAVTMGYFIILWPLAFLNHRLLYRVYRDIQ